MKVSEKTKRQWEVVISHTERIKPEFGSISLEFVYHQGVIKKVKYLQKEDVLVIDKNIVENEEKNHE